MIGLVTLAIGILTVLFFLSKKGKKEEAEEEQAVAPAGRNLNRPRANADHPARNRLRNRNQIRNVAAQQGNFKDALLELNKIRFSGSKYFIHESNYLNRLLGLLSH